jgi:hypothetical protein
MIPEHVEIEDLKSLKTKLVFNPKDGIWKSPKQEDE